MTGRWSLSADPSSEAAASRAARIARWLHLARVALPAAASRHNWPIRLDHCFMRLCLDHVFADRWDRHLRRPAIRHLDDAQLEAAIACAERILADPALLPELNRASLAARRRLPERD